MSTHSSPLSSSPESPTLSNLLTLISGETGTIDAHTTPRRATPHEPEHRNTSASYHRNSEREPQYTEGVQEHWNADRPPMGPPQFSTRQKYKKWSFNPLDALKKFFSRERKESKRKAWM
ncbi:hypothetical protein BJV78DRAFT_1355933 [Lactifluus subvellereus]|nr:hypothetical protein BJV78DRAFT_1355933 [Lactifluus subvellereus]